MPDIYRHAVTKFVSQGLMLRAPVDLVPQPFYSAFDNVTERIEGQLSARQGLHRQQIITSNPIRSLFRLNEQVPSVNTERLLSDGSNLWAQDIVANTPYAQLTGPTFDGNPLSIIDFRFDNDPSAWAIIGNSSAMMKQRQPDLYQVLGQTPPTVAAVASDDGAGLLDSTGGPGFDWVYTYMNGITRTESNASPANVTTGPDAPTTNTNPDPTIGGNGCFNPANAYDGDPNTYANFGSTGGTSFDQSTSCLFSGFSAAASVPATLVLSIVYETILTYAGGPRLVDAVIQYSLNSGTTWSTVISTTGTIAKTTAAVTLPAAQDLTLVMVRAYTEGTAGSGTHPTNSIQLKLYEISTNASGSSVTTLALVNRQAQVCVTPPTDPQQTLIRLYRRGGSLVNGHYLAVEATVSALVIGTCGAGTLAIIDNVPDVSLGDLLLLDNDVPVSSVSNTAVPLPAIWGPFQSRVLGCGDTGRPDAVYFSKAGNADAWPPENWVTTSSPSEPMMNGCVYNTRCFAFSTERLYELVPGLISGVTFSPYPTPCSRGLISRWALCVSDAIYFVAKDGVYRTEGGAQQSLVENTIQPLFPTKDAPGEDTLGYEAVDLSATESLRLDYHNAEIYFTYKGATTGDLQTLIYDTVKNRWRAAEYTPAVTTFYTEPSTASSLLIGGEDGDLYTPQTGQDVTHAISCHFRTGAYDMGDALSQKEYGNVLFDVDPNGGTITIVPYINGDTVAAPALTITGSGRQQVPLSLSDVIAYNISFDVSWDRTATVNPILYQLDILWRPEPTAVTHWEVRESSYGIPGYFHIRDGYMGLRSTSDVVLSVWGDGALLFTTTFASTSGSRQRVYFACPSNKAKEYRFSLDSATSAPFRVYVEDMCFRMKPFITLLGYKEVHALGADAATIGATIEGNIAAGTK